MSTISDMSGMQAQMADARNETQELVRYKQRMDSLKQRLGKAPDEEQELRKACRDFEAVFIGKLWEQMRRTVPKGETHSKQEDMYLSMFDRSFSEHMADSGGIGLADMLYDQLAARLRSASNDTLPGDAAVKPLERNGKADVKPLAETRLDTRLERGPEPEMPVELERPVEAGEVSPAGETEDRDGPGPVSGMTPPQVDARLERLADELQRRAGYTAGRILAEYE